MTRTRKLGMLICALVSSAAGLGSPTMAVGPSGEGDRMSRGVCTGVSRCHVKAYADVDGDGSRDRIAIARRGANRAPSGAVIVRVKTGPNRIESARYPTSYWSGPLWQGVARLDGRAGKEIVVGHSMGAHTLFYQAVTWRHGDLVRLNAPGRGRLWVIDSAYTVAFGWLRRSDDPVGRVIKRTALRTGTEPQSGFEGRAVTYQWTRDGWDKVVVRFVEPLPERQAYRWAGFHIPGLPRW